MPIRYKKCAENLVKTMCQKTLYRNILSQQNSHLRLLLVVLSSHLNINF